MVIEAVCNERGNPRHSRINTLMDTYNPQTQQNKHLSNFKASWNETGRNCSLKFIKLGSLFQLYPSVCLPGSKSHWTQDDLLLKYTCLRMHGKKTMKSSRGTSQKEDWSINWVLLLSKCRHEPFPTLSKDNLKPLLQIYCTRTTYHFCSKIQLVLNVVLYYLQMLK